MVYPHMASQETAESKQESKSTLISRNITVLGHRTSVRLEPEMWNALKDISRREDCKIHDICSLIHMRKKANTSLTAAIRVFLMLYYKAASTEDGHMRAGHGNFKSMLERAQVTTGKMASLRNGSGHKPAYSPQPEARMRQRDSVSQMGKSRQSFMRHDLMNHKTLPGTENAPSKQAAGF